MEDDILTHKLLNIFEFFGTTVLGILEKYFFIEFCRMITKTLTLVQQRPEYSGSAKHPPTATPGIFRLRIDVECSSGNDLLKASNKRHTTI